MKTQRVSLALIVVNLILLGLQFAHGSPKQSEPVASIVRARAFELVDDQGRVRAELGVQPAQPDLKISDGSKGFPEAVQLRLLTSKNGPNVKLVTTEDGAGLVLGGDRGYIQLLSRSAEDPLIKIALKDGREKVLRP
jgi:hypothetical protein